MPPSKHPCNQFPPPPPKLVSFAGINRTRISRAKDFDIPVLQCSKSNGKLAKWTHAWIPNSGVRLNGLIREIHVSRGMIFSSFLYTQIQGLVSYYCFGRMGPIQSLSKPPKMFLKVFLWYPDKQEGHKSGDDTFNQRTRVGGWKTSCYPMIKSICLGPE